MTKIEATVNLDSATDQNNLLQRLDELQSVAEEIDNHADALSNMGYKLDFTANNGELVVQLQPK